MSPTRATLCKLSTLALGSVASLFVAALVVNASVIAAPAEKVAQTALVGAWKTQTYTLRDGPAHRVEGMILFTESDWSVLFFVVDDDAKPQRGSAEGGTYELDGDALTFTHLYNASGGHAVEGLAASEWRMSINEPDQAPAELCRIDLSGERLTIHFPSGNHMTFTRSS